MLSWRPSISIFYPWAAPKEPEVVPVSVNWFPNRRCNYECSFCFHTSKNTFILPMDKAKQGLQLLANAGMKKLNISGGEPFLNAKYIGEVFQFCKEELHLESTSVVCNGSKVTEKWMEQYAQYLDVMAISCDTFDSETNEKHGRGDKGGRDGHISNVAEVVDMCKRYNVKVKINSVITIYNWEEDMNESIARLNPFRWKVFQVLLLDGENTGSQTNSIRDARHLTITSEQFQAFLERHKSQPSLVPEDNEAMRDSYLNLDEEMRFLNCEEGSKIAGRSILVVGVEEAIKDSGFNSKAFHDRGGIYEWKGEKPVEEIDW